MGVGGAAGDRVVGTSMVAGPDEWDVVKGSVAR
jgi:hypothetical protein